MPQLPPRYRKVPSNSFLATKPPAAVQPAPQAPRAQPLPENVDSPRPKISSVPLVSLKDSPLTSDQVAALLFNPEAAGVHGR